MGIFLSAPHLALAAPTTGTTSFPASGGFTTIGNQTSPRSVNYLGFTFRAVSGGNVSISQVGTAVNLLVVSGGPTYLGFGSDDSSKFKLNSFRFRATVANYATTLTLTGYSAGSAVSGATSTLTVTASGPGSEVTWDVSAITGFQNIDEVRITGPTTGSGGVALVNITIATAVTPAVAPTVTTNAASNITPTGATLNASVNANGSSTAVTFEYGLTTSYGNSITATPSPVSGSSATPVTALLSGLAPGQTYNFRAVGVNAGGTINGLNQSFTVGPGVVIDFETAGTGSASTGSSSFTSSALTWTTTSPTTVQTSTGLSSAPPGLATPAGNGFTDSGYGLSRTVGTNIGGIKAPAGYVFRAASIDVWPSSDSGFNVYGGSANNLGTVGLNYQVLGKRAGSTVVTANVTDTARTPPQSGSIAGGYWHHVNLTGTAFATTDVDTIEFVIVAQTGAAMNYIALDNLTYSSLTATSTTVTSLNRVNPATTNLSTVNWTLTFAAANTGVTASNFSLGGTAASGANVGTPTTTNGGLTWNVPVTTGSTSGSLTLSLANSTGTTPGVSTALPFAGESYTMDKIVPTIGISAPSVSSVATGGSVTYTVTYADTNFSSSTLANGNITLNTTGNAGGTIGVSGSGLTRTVTISNITGAGTLGISIAAGTASDTVGNTAPAAGPSTTFSVLSNNADLSALALTTATLNETFAANTTNYTATVPNTTSSVTVTANRAQANATLQVQLNSGGFSALTTGVASGNLALNLGPNTVDVRVTAQDGTTIKTYTITVTRAAPPDLIAPLAISSNRQPQTSLVVSGASTVFRVTFSESVTGVDISDFNLVKVGTVNGTVASISGSGTTYDVTVNGISGFGSLRLDLNSSGTGIVDGASNALTDGFYNGQSVRVGTGVPIFWGNNTVGQAGDGTTGGNKAFPNAVDVSGVLSGKNIVSAVSAGNITHVLTADNLLYVWGNNTSGHFGNGTTGTQSNVPISVPMTGVLTGKTLINFAAGDSTVYALDSDGLLCAWGVGTSGQLGDGLNSSSNTPVAVSTSGALSGKVVVGVAAGPAFCVACTSDGGIYTWGNAGNGRLGNGTTTPNVTAPAQLGGVFTGKRVVAVSAGGSYAAALTSDGKVYTWGNNSQGQLGDGGTVGTPANNPTPALLGGTGLPGGKTVAQIFCSNLTMYALARDGTLYAWGGGTLGGLGNGGTTSSTSPVLVTTSGVLAGKTIVSLAGGNNFAYVLTTEGKAYSWGTNASAQLGDGTTNQQNTPIAVDISASSALNGRTISFLTQSNQPAFSVAVANAAAPPVAPTIASLSSTTTNGAYAATTVIPITVTFSAAVTVTGTPTLALNSGGSASYASGSGTSTLTFNYTVGAGQNTSTVLDYTTTSALALAGGTINATTGGTAATLTLPTPGGTGSLGLNKALVIDTTPPTITSITRQTPSGQTTASNTVTFRVTYSEPVTGPGTSNFSVVAVNSSSIVGTITGVTGTGNTRDVTVTITSGTGEFRLRAVN